MCSRCSSRQAVLALALTAIVAAGLAACAAPAASRSPRNRARELRVCADPNNLPFSNDRLEGFENRLAELIGSDLHAKVGYAWRAQRRGFVRNTLTAGACDVMLGVPTGMDPVLTTRPYYRSTYVFVTRADRRLHIRSFNDPILRRLRVGVQIIGNDHTSSPPAHALAERHIIDNVVGYSVFGDYSQPNPPARIVDAVARGDVDAAVVWGPLAGFFASRQKVPLDLVPVSPQVDVPYLPFVFDIAMGVRRGNTGLRDELDGVIERRRADIDRILDEYGVPRVAEPGEEGQ